MKSFLPGLKQTAVAFLALFVWFCGYTQTVYCTTLGGSSATGDVITSLDPLVASTGNGTFMAEQWNLGTIGEVRSLLQFNLAQIPAGAVVLSASLNLYGDTVPNHIYEGAYTTGTNNACYLKMVTSTWNDFTNWDNQPNTTTSNEVYVASESSPQNLLNIDVSGMVSQWVSGAAANNGFMLQMITQSANNAMVFASGTNTESALWPTLTICYTLPAANCGTNAAFYYQNLGGGFIQFDNESFSINGFTSYWIFQTGNGTVTTTDENPFEIFSVNNIQAILIVTDSLNPQCSDTVTQNINLGGGCLSTASFSYQFNSPTNIQFVNTSTSPDGYYSNWQFINSQGEFASSQLADPDITITGSSPFIAMLIVTDSQNVQCQDTIEETIPQLNNCSTSSAFTYTYQNGTGLLDLINESFSLNGFSSYWIISSIYGTSTTSGFDAAIYFDADTFTVTLIVTDSLNPLCTDTSTQIITSNSLCSAQASFNYQNTGSSTVQFTNSSSSINGYISSWTFYNLQGAFATSNAQNPLITFSGQPPFAAFLHIMDSLNASCVDTFSESITGLSTSNCVVLQGSFKLDSTAMIGSTWPDTVYNKLGGGDSVLSWIDASQWTYNGLPGEKRSFLKFNLSSIPANAVITSATLSLFADDTTSDGYVDEPTYGSANACYLQQVTSQWSALGVTWNNQPSVSTVGEVLVPQSTSVSENYTNLDISNIVQGWVSNSIPNYGLRLQMITQDYYNSMIFCSSTYPDTSKRPKLTICYYTLSCNTLASFTSQNTAGTIVQFTNNSSSADGYTAQWTFYNSQGQFATSADINPTVGFTGLQPYSAKLVVTDNTNPACVDSITESVTINNATCVTLQFGSNSASTALLAEDNPNTNFSQNIEFLSMQWTVNLVPTEGRSLLRYNLSQIPVGATIVSASLNLYGDTAASNGYRGQPTYGTDNASYLYVVTSSWNEDSVTWNTQPSTTETNEVLLAQSTNTDENYYNLNLTNIVQGWVNNPASNYGLKLQMIGQNYYNSMVFCGGAYPDSNFRPFLAVCYISPCNTTASFTGQNNSGTTVQFANASNSTNGYASSWTFYNANGPFTTSSAANPLITFTGEPPYSAKLIVTDLTNSGCVDSITQNVSVSNVTCITLGGSNNPSNGAEISAYTPNTNISDYYEFGASQWTYNTVPAEVRGFLIYNLSQIPAGATILNARLNLYADTLTHNAYPDEPTYGSNNACYLKQITSSWTPSTVTWNNQPTSTTSNEVLLAQSTNYIENYLNLDVSAIVQNWVNGATNDGFLLQMITPNHYNSMYFGSAFNTDSAIWPKLEICYSLPCHTTASFTDQNTSGTTVQFTNASGSTNGFNSSWTFYNSSGPLSTSTAKNPTVTFSGQPPYSAKLIVTDSSNAGCTDSTTQNVSISNITCITLGGSNNPSNGAEISAYTPNTNISDYYEFGASQWTYNTVPAEVRGFLIYNLSQIPAGATILSARLNLYADTLTHNAYPDEPTYGSNNACYLKQITSSWSPATVTWNNQPTSTSSNEVLLAQSTNYIENYLNLDVSAIVQNWVDGAANDGFLLQMITPNHYNSMYFGSAFNTDSAIWPRLEICYTVTDTLCGKVFNDANGNGVQDPTESVITNAAVLVNGTTYYTDSTGYYHAPVNSGAGTNTISLVVPVAWQQTYPVSPPTYTVIFSDSNTCGFNFGMNVNVPANDCYSFDNVTVPSDSQQQAFNLYGNGHGGFLQDWNVTSGTPSIQPSGSVPGVNAYDGSQFALIGVCNSGVNQSEGVSLLHNFQAGQSYQVSMAIRNVPITSDTPVAIDLDFILLKNGIHYTYNPYTGCSETPAVPVGSLLVDSINNYDQNAWSVISFTINNLPADYTQLWFKVGFTNGYNINSTALCFDSVCIQPYGPCQARASFTGQNNSGSTVQFTNTSTSTNGYFSNWTFYNSNGQFGTSTQANPSVDYIGQAPFSATLIITDSVRGCSDTVTQTVIVNTNTTCVTILQSPTEIANTYIYSLDPNTNESTIGYKDFTALQWTWDGVPGEVRGLIQFNLSAIPANAVIQSASLSLYADDTSSIARQGQPDYGSDACYLQQITTPWQTNTVTWNTAPGTTTAGELTLPQSSSPVEDYPNLDVTGFVQGWVQNPATNYGLLLRTVTNTYYSSLVFCSSGNADSVKRPKLQICYTLPPCSARASFTYQNPTGGTVQFTNTSTATGSYYSNWSFSNSGGQFTASAATNPSVTYVGLPPFSATLIITDSLQQCSDTITEIIPLHTDTVCVTLQQGPEQTLNSYIFSLVPDSNVYSYPDFPAMQWTWNGVPGEVRGLIKFNFSSIPANAPILSAALSVYANDTSGINLHPGEATYGTNNACYLEQVTSAWSPNTVTWNTAPGTTLNGAITLAQSTSYTENYQNIDITSFARAWQQNPGTNYGLMLKLLTGNYYNCMIFCSSGYPDTALRPKLEVCYIAPLCNTSASFTQQNITGNSVQFTNTSSSAGGFSLNWTFYNSVGAFATSSATNPTVNFIGQPPYSATLVVTDSTYGCTASDTASIILTKYTLCGKVFNDANGNGIQDPTEGVITNAAVLVNGITYYTDSIGYYYASVSPGNQTISLIVPIAWQQTYPLNPSSYSISGLDSNSCGFNFGIKVNVPASQCYSFDNVNVPPANQQDAFDIYGNGTAGFLQDWNVTSGTPSIQPSGSIPGVNAYDGDQFAIIGVCNSGANQSEGVSLLHNFQAGHSYQVSMAVRNAPITSDTPVAINVDFILLKNTIQYTYNFNTGCSETPAVPAGSLLVDSINNYDQNSWSVISFVITNLTSDYTQLWFKVGFPNGSNANTTGLCFDSVCVHPYVSCQATASFTDQNGAGSTVQFTNTSTSTNGYFSNWTFYNSGGQFATSTATNPAINFTGTAPFSATLIITDSVKGCSDTVTQAISVGTCITYQLAPHSATGSIISNYYPNLNSGSSDAFTDGQWTINGVPEEGRGLMRFDLSQIPVGSTILSASLSLYADSFTTDNYPGEPTYGDNDASYLKRITSPWEQFTVTWNNQPATTDSDEVLLPQSTNDDENYLGLNVQNFVQQWVNNPGANYGFMSVMITQNYYNSLVFFSGNTPDSTFRPKIEICYIPPVCRASASFTYQNAAGSVVQFTNTSASTSGYNSYWTFYNAAGQFATSATANPTINFTGDAPFSAALVITDSIQGCTDTITQTIVINSYINCIALQPSFTIDSTAEILSYLPDTNFNRYNGSQIPQDWMSTARWTWNGTPGETRSFFKFNLSALPPGAVISSATLSLWADDSTSEGYQAEPMYGNNNASYLQRVAAPWGALTVNWNNQPDVDTIGQVLLPQSTSTTENYLGLDVTGFVQSWYSNPVTNYGLRLNMITDNYYNSMIFCSSEFWDSTRRPKLDICYTIPKCYANASFTYQNTTGNTVQFNNTSISSNGYTSNWTFYNGNGQFATSTAANPSVNLTGQPPYSAVLVVTDSLKGCSASDSVGIMLTTYTVCGKVFNDANANGVQDPPEGVITNAAVLIDGITYYTDSTGYYYASISGNSHTISLVVPVDWQQSYPLNPSSYTITSLDSNTCGFNFGMYVNVPSSDCYSFDNVTVPGDSQQQAFDLYGNGHAGFLEDWNVTSGTPSIQPSGSIPGVNAYDGDQFALIGVCNAAPDWSEGVSLLHNFQAGQSYQVSMAIRNAPITSDVPVPINVDFILLQNTIQYPYNANTGCSPTPAIPAGALIVDSINNYDQNSWSVISFTIGNLTSDYTQLWFRVGFTDGYNINTTGLCFDSVCIHAVTPCFAVASFTDENTDGSTVKFTNTSTSQNGYYSTWIFSNASGKFAGSTATNPTVNYRGDGPFSATLIVTDSIGGCSDTVTQPVNVATSADCITLQFAPYSAAGAGLAQDFPNENFHQDIEFSSEHWTVNGVPTEGRGLLQYNLSQIPPGATIVSARLSLYADTVASNGYQGQPTYGNDNASYLLKVNSSWSLDSVTWNTQPSTTDSNAVLLAQSTSTAENYLGLNVRHIVQEWVNDPATNFGLKLQMIGQNYYNSMIFCGGSYPDSTLRPKLEVCFLPPTLCNANAGFTYSDQGNNTAAFTNTSTSTNGYTSNWTFYNASSQLGSSSMNNPQFTFTGQSPYMARLIITDSLYGCSDTTIQVIALMQCLTLRYGAIHSTGAVLSAYQANTNFGNHPDFMADQWSIDSKPYEARSLLKYDLAQIPAGSVITSANLSLFADTLSSSSYPGEPTYGNNNACYLKNVTSAWDQFSVTWDNQPNTTNDGAVLLPQSTGTAENYPNLDVTGLVQGWVSNPAANNGVMIQMITDNFYNAMIFASSQNSDSTLWPELEICYTTSSTPCSANFTYVNSNDTVYFQNTSPGVTNAIVWTFGDGSASTQNNPVHVYAQNGSYTTILTILDSTGTCADTAVVYVTGISNDTLTGLVFNDLNGNGQLDVGEPGIANDTVFVDGYPYITDTSGIYLAAVTAGNHTINIHVPLNWVQTLPQFPQYLIATTNGEYLAGLDFGISTGKNPLGIQSLNGNLPGNMTIFPNPTNGRLINIKMPESFDMNGSTVTLLNTLGQEVPVAIIDRKANMFLVNLSDGIEAGVYVVVVKNNDKQLCGMLSLVH